VNLPSHQHTTACSIVCPSTPAAPPLDLTALYASYATFLSMLNGLFVAFVVTLPKAMRFKAPASSAPFKLLNFLSQPAQRHSASGIKRHGRQNLVFNISGEGAHETGQQRSSQDSVAGEQRSTRGASPAESNNRPGGGLGPPIGVPDPLNRYRWWVLGGAGAVLLIGGIY